MSYVVCMSIKIGISRCDWECYGLSTVLIESKEQERLQDGGGGHREVSMTPIWVGY